MKRSRINPVNRSRKARMFERNFHSKERVVFVKSQPCIVCRRTPSENAHITARGMGGCNSSYKDIVPLCSVHHREQGDIGNAKFEIKHNIDLKVEAERLEEKWMQ